MSMFNSIWRDAATPFPSSLLKRNTNSKVRLGIKGFQRKLSSLTDQLCLLCFPLLQMFKLNCKRCSLFNKIDVLAFLKVGYDEPFG